MSHKFEKFFAANVYIGIYETNPKFGFICENLLFILGKEANYV